MPCPSGTGPCTTPVDGACIAPKIFEELVPLVVTSLVGFDNSVQIFWDRSTLYSNQTVTCFARTNGNKLTTRTIGPRDAGSIKTPNIFTTGDEVDIFIRVEDADGYWSWQLYEGISEQGWTYEFPLVTYKGDIVTYKGEAVLYEET